MIKVTTAATRTISAGMVAHIATSDLKLMRGKAQVASVAKGATDVAKANLAVIDAELTARNWV